MVELKRLFPGVTDNVQARECARTIAGWKPAGFRRVSLPLIPGRQRGGPSLSAVRDTSPASHACRRIVTVNPDCGYDRLPPLSSQIGLPSGSYGTRMRLASASAQSNSGSARGSRGFPPGGLSGAPSPSREGSFEFLAPAWVSHSLPVSLPAVLRSRHALALPARRFDRLLRVEPPSYPAGCQPRPPRRVERDRLPLLRRALVAVGRGDDVGHAWPPSITA